MPPVDCAASGVAEDGAVVGAETAGVAAAGGVVCAVDAGTPIGTVIGEVAGGGAVGAAGAGLSVIDAGGAGAAAAAIGGVAGGAGVGAGAVTGVGGDVTGGAGAGLGVGAEAAGGVAVGGVGTTVTLPPAALRAAATGSAASVLIVTPSAGLVGSDAGVVPRPTFCRYFSSSALSAVCHGAPQLAQNTLPAIITRSFSSQSGH